MDPRPQTPSNRSRALLAAVRRDAAFAWRLSPSLAVGALLAPWIGAALVAIAGVDGALFGFLTRELSVLAWLAVAAWVAAAALAAATARELWRARRDAAFVGYAALTVLCGFAAGQLSSWGVPLLGQDAPSGLLLLNREQALDEAAVLLPALFGILGCYGAAAPWIARRRGRAATEVTRLAVPPLFLSSAFLLVALYEGVRVAVGGAAVEAFGVWPQLCLPTAVAAFARLTQQRLSRASAPVLPALRPAAG